MLPRNIATLGSNKFTLSALARANFDDGKENLPNVAQLRIDAIGAKVAVMGYTHRPDQKQLDGGMYYNPGCWTRYLELQGRQKATLEDLKDESRYPYQLKAVRVEGGAVKSEMVFLSGGDFRGGIRWIRGWRTSFWRDFISGLL